MIQMAPQQISLEVFAEKYAKGAEVAPVDLHRRVAAALATAEAIENRESFETVFLQAMAAGFIPAGRVMSAAGTNIAATLVNCFVQPVGDAISGVDGDSPGIYPALIEATETMRRGGGVGYNFSAIRPRGAFVKSTASMASGPISYMHVFDRSCETVESAGSRRGAQMGVLDVSHPDIVEFIEAKATTGALKNFNISVGVSDAFMTAVQKNEPFDLVHKAEPAQPSKDAGAYQRDDGLWVYRVVQARELWEKIMRSTYEVAEPGVLFLDRMNAENNLYYCESIRATNPCAEEPLPPYGCCCLGSVNLTLFVIKAFTAYATFDFDAFKAVVRTAVRMLDNVLDVTYWPLPQQEAESKAKRRIGLGYLGLGDALIMLGLRYDSKAGRDMAAKITECMRDESYMASVELAKERGSFPLFDKAKFLASGFALRLPVRVRAAISKHGIRNSHLMAIAPTGTITLAFADNASNGIEPAFSWTYNRNKRNASGGTDVFEVADHAWRVYREMEGDIANLPPQFVTALEMSALDHMRMLEAVGPYVDTSISKTVNVPGDYPYGDFQSLYMEAWKAGLKGLATYRPNAARGSVLSVTPAPVVVTAASATSVPTVSINPLEVRIPRRPGGELEGVNLRVDYSTLEGARSVYVNIGFMKVACVIDGQGVEVERPIEIFMPASQATDGQQWISSHMRILSLALRHGVPASSALTNMIEVTWDKGSVRCGTITKADGSTAPRFFDSEVAAIGYEIQQVLVRRGYLSASGRERPVKDLIKRTEGGSSSSRSDTPDGHVGTEAATPVAQPVQRHPQGTGKKCFDCGAHDMHRVDGCEMCGNCGAVGSCG